MPTVAIVAPGNMGAAVAKRLTENKVTVLTALAGRSEASIKRARDAGMQGVEDRELAKADFLLSIVPPGDALALAKRLADVLAESNSKPIYVECNAVSPQTVTGIAEVVKTTGCAFVGAGIIGPPPKPGSTNTKFYAAGPHAKDFAVLNNYGLIVRVLEGPLTAASALKMSYAGITKGFQELGASMALGAGRNGAQESLVAELKASQPQLYGWLSKSLPSMYDKAYRWDGEMREIAKFLLPEQGASTMLAGAADLYEHIAEDNRAGPQSEIISTLNRFIGR
jgi:3-hydroxyisobutyrate dehydrogenase-like beta-hydroxyacid dehydrogenase